MSVSVLDRPDASIADAAALDASACGACERPCCTYDQMTGRTVPPFCPPPMYECGGPPPTDAGTRDAAVRDGGVGAGPHFTLEPADVDFFLTFQRCSATAGGPLILNAMVHYFSSCDSPAPIFTSVDAASRTITVTPHVWREHRDDCRAVGAAFVPRDVRVDGLTEGTWTVVHPRGRFDVNVGARPPAACTGLIPSGLGGACFADCDCERGLSCTPQRGDIACSSTCQAPCEVASAPDQRGPGLECALGSTCGTDPNWGDSCRTRVLDECGPGAPCPAGMRCISDTGDATSYCDWDIELSSANRIACTSGADCAAGLDCVEHAGGTRRCEVRCATRTMTCPGRAPHACNYRGICEWLGE